MDSLEVKLTEYTPEIVFKPSNSVFSIKGKSLPENAVDFYKPIYEWIASYSNQNTSQSIVLDVDIEYMNSSSIKLLFYIFNTIDKHYQNNKNSTTCINWYCNKDDELMVQKGNEFKGLLELPFNIKFKS